VRTFFKRANIDSIEALEKRSYQLTGRDWVFRGHKNSRLGLTTTLHLACRRHNVARRDVAHIEQMLMREFARKAHLYVRGAAELPHPADTLEWLSLMRHYGAPTRLLDWTYSIFVAAFFALDATRPGESARIWAINARWLNERANDAWGNSIKELEGDVDKTGEHFRRHFMPKAPDTPRAFVATANPYRVNARLAIQHGVFLCLGNVQRSFESNLRAMMGRHERHQAWEFRLSESRQFREDLTGLLARQNINTEVLFPGLEGLARALRDRIPELQSRPRNRGRIDWYGRAPLDEDLVRRAAAQTGTTRRAGRGRSPFAKHARSVRSVKTPG
jgi:hypothetical protein